MGDGLGGLRIARRSSSLEGVASTLLRVELSRAA